MPCYCVYEKMNSIKFAIFTEPKIMNQITSISDHLL